MSRLSLSRKPIRLFIIFTLAFIISLPIIYPLEVAAAQSNDQSQCYNSQFAWDYGGNHWIWNLSIPEALYNAYKAVPDSVRIQYGISDFGFFTTTEDSYIQNLAERLNETATQLGYSAYDQVNFVLAFVQSIPYKTDNASTGYQDYPRFPVETLVDDVGDCKSHSILFAAIMLILDAGTVYINPPDHLAVGILGNGLSGAYFTYNNESYYYCETTGVGFTMGQLPDQFNGVSAYVYPIDVSEQYVPNFQTAASIGPGPTLSPYTPTQTLDPNPTASPAVPEPTIQPVLPLSFNLISDNPIYFAIIVIAIAISITATIKTKNPNEQLLTNQTFSSGQSSPTAESNKFCIYCGSSNKSFALYCEKCGKKTA